MKGGRGYKQWSVNGAPFRGSPYYSISSAGTLTTAWPQPPRGRRMGRGRRWKEPTRAAPRQTAAQASPRAELYTAQYSHDSPRLQSRPTAAQDPNCSAVCRAGFPARSRAVCRPRRGNTLRGKFPPWEIPSVGPAVRRGQLRTLIQTRSSFDWHGECVETGYVRVGWR